MAALSDTLEQALLNHVFRNTAYTSPTTVYLALFTTDPTDTGTGSELADSGYARQTVTFSAPVASAGGHAVSNAATVEFPAIVDGQVTVSHFAVYDAATAGTLLAHGSFTSSRTLSIDDIPTVAAGAVTITMK